METEEKIPANQPGFSFGERQNQPSLFSANLLRTSKRPLR
jgi:hypothetical protein